MTSLNKPLQVSITGGIGTGKSTVCKIFSALSIPIYEADVRSKILLENHIGLKQELINAFGEKAYENGKYNRSYLANIVFHDKEKNKIINDIVHPKIYEDYEIWLEEYKNVKYVLKESALLFESGGDKKTDRIIVVTAPKELRMKRVLKRDTFRTEEEIYAIMDKQIPDEEKVKHAHFIIINDEKQFLIPQVLKIHEECNKL